KNLVDEVCLIDIKENVAKSHELDMEQALIKCSDVKVSSGSFQKLEGSDIVVISAGIPQQKVSSRLQYLDGNLKIIKEISDNLNTYTNNPIVITMTSPVDILNVYLNKNTHIDSNRLLGYSYNDTYRFKWAIANVLDVDFNDIEAYVLGEHGETQCPIYSNIKIKGKKINLTNENRPKIDDMVKNWWSNYQSLNSGRASGWLSGTSIAHIVYTIVNDTDEVIPFSVIDEDGVSIGTPIQVNKNGIKEIIEIETTEEEKINLNISKASIMEQLIYAQQLNVS